MRKMFAKRHYEAIATAMAQARSGLFWDAMRVQWNTDVKGLAAMFERDNVAFRPSQFIEACGGLFNV